MEEIQRLGRLTFIALDDTLAQEAAELAARHRLRGSDAVYVAVARRFGATLITLDAVQGERIAEVIPVRQPVTQHESYTAYDPLLAMNISRVDPLPHQIEAVYGYILHQPRARFLVIEVRQSTLATPMARRQ